MRIIAGKARGRKLIPPATMETRPTLDRVKEAMFSTIQNYLLDAVVGKNRYEQNKKCYAKYNIWYGFKNISNYCAVFDENSNDILNECRIFRIE